MADAAELIMTCKRATPYSWLYFWILAGSLRLRIFNLKKTPAYNLSIYHCVHQQLPSSFQF
jgi:hypothetical protein